MISLPKNEDLSLAQSLELETPVVEAELVEVDNLEEMSLVQFQKEKKALEIKRKNLALRLDGRKLKQAEKIMDAMDITLDRILEAYDKDVVSAQDLNFLASAYERLAKTLGTVSRLDTVDGTGKAARITLEVQYEK